MQPTLLSSCAYAATAAEARFRINARPQPVRQSRVVALDRGAEAVIRPVIGMPWRSTVFLSYAGPPGGVPAQRDDLADITLNTVTGLPVRLGEELNGTDFVMMVATSNEGAVAASSIGVACTLRSIMTAAVVFGAGHAVDATVSALRPYSRVLLVSRDEQDVVEILSVVAS